MAAAAADAEAEADDAGKGGKDGGGGAAVAESLSLANLAVVWRFCGSVLVNMVAVYALEYLVTAGLLQVPRCAFECALVLRTHLCPIRLAISPRRVRIAHPPPDQPPPTHPPAPPRRTVEPSHHRT